MIMLPMTVRSLLRLIFMLCGCPAPSNTFLPDHPQDVIDQDYQFQYQFITLKFAGKQPLQTHVCIDFAMELLTFAVGVVESDNFAVGQSRVCPSYIGFNITFQKELAIFIYGTVNNLIPSTDGDSFFLSLPLFIGNRLPVAADVDGFPLMGRFHIPAFSCAILSLQRLRFIMK